MTLLISMLNPGDLVYVIPVFDERKHGTALILEIKRIGFHAALNVLFYDGTTSMVGMAQIWNKESALKESDLSAIKFFLQQYGYDHRDGQKL